MTMKGDRHQGTHKWKCFPFNRHADFFQNRVPIKKPVAAKFKFLSRGCDHEETMFFLARIGDFRNVIDSHGGMFQR